MRNRKTVIAFIYIIILFITATLFQTGGYSQEKSIEKETKAEEDQRSEPIETDSGSKLLATKDTGRTLRNNQDRFSSNNVYSDLSSVRISPQSGSVDIDVTDITLPGKNGFDLEISRHYDTGTAQSDSSDSSSWCAGRHRIFSGAWMAFDAALRKKTHKLG